MSPEKEKAVKRYISQRIKRFKDDMLNIAIEYDHPYIDAILIRLISEFKRDAIEKIADVRDQEYRFMNPQYDY